MKCPYVMESALVTIPAIFCIIPLGKVLSNMRFFDFHLYTILDIMYRFLEEGRFNQLRVDTGRLRYSANFKEECWSFFVIIQRLTNRDSAAIFNVSHTYIWGLLKRKNLHPFHFTKVQELMPED